MDTKPTNADAPKHVKPTTGRPGVASNDESSKPIDASKWKARRALLLTAGEAVPPKPTNGDAPPGKSESGATAPKPRSHRKKPPAARDDGAPAEPAAVNPGPPKP